MNPGIGKSTLGQFARNRILPSSASSDIRHPALVRPHGPFGDAVRGAPVVFGRFAKFSYKSAVRTSQRLPNLPSPSCKLPAQKAKIPIAPPSTMVLRTVRDQVLAQNVLTSGFDRHPQRVAVTRARAPSPAIGNGDTRRCAHRLLTRPARHGACAAGH
jgi:hypothetical protein